MTFIADLSDLMPDTVTAIRVVNDGYGDYIPSGQIQFRARIEANNHLVRAAGTGNEVVSSAIIYADGFYGLGVDTHRFTLPDRYSPREEIRAIAIEPYTDEDGECYESIHLP